ncbi:ferritin-like domain-containing protein [Dermatobacter hominis]|uniref:ferritin-like domain-containing protein n=1 Tax=Dermatobacter hominis TaxID=2884263 RepID=UPI001D129853|nr:ferritin-like protein [Dermatobacter hominis]UDY37316.1 ferritin-like protein [Dermatobacter hominis]
MDHRQERPDGGFTGTAPAAVAQRTVGIATLDDLREHLQWAIELEHATIPSYLCALYSLDAARNLDAVEIIHSIFLEEMLHLALVANLLNAVGGRPELDTPRLMPGGERTLPHRDPPLVLSLLPFGPEALELFLQIEQPGAPDAPPQADSYSTIGQFYEAIRCGLVDLVGELGPTAVFCGDPERQIADDEFRAGPGRIFEVTGLESAIEALDLIVHQGEGTGHVEVWDGDHDMFHPERKAVGHYYRLLQLTLGRRFRPGDTPASGPSGDPITIDWTAVSPMRRDPRTADFPDGPIRAAMDLFNATYATVLNRLERAFDGRREVFSSAVSAMFHVRTNAVTLMSMTIDGTDETAGPSFEYIEPDRR